jgi:hypothetical protein
MNELFIVLVVLVVASIAYKVGEYSSKKKNTPDVGNKTFKGKSDLLDNTQKDNTKK